MNGYAPRLYFETWRWAGVLFYIHAGKCPPSTGTEAIVHTKRPPLAIFDEPHTIGSSYPRGAPC
ncbi:MAG: hypothetical protein A3E01_14440 [Gammaproteobacteria bacterium RIFCSPHIGHO2_12_FULL_63_22]|nr:MAG: hypothetical protein A3E01_14440 [Gammaproteobacteria bacterium RIFCSPHIGHO2_12_FULL_63_22]